MGVRGNEMFHEQGDKGHPSDKNRITHPEELIVQDRNWHYERGRGEGFTHVAKTSYLS